MGAARTRPNGSEADILIQTAVIGTLLTFSDMEVN